MNFISKLAIKLSSRFVGRDMFGNSYYETRKAVRGGRTSRYVIFKGEVEASKVPSDWHGWLHHTEQSPPPADGYARHDWQQEHVPNLTGTRYAHRPAGHVLKGGKRAAATGDYGPWQPS